MKRWLARGERPPSPVRVPSSGGNGASGAPPGPSEGSGASLSPAYPASHQERRQGLQAGNSVAIPVVLSIATNESVSWTGNLSYEPTIRPLEWIVIDWTEDGPPASPNLTAAGFTGVPAPFVRPGGGRRLGASGRQSCQASAGLSTTGVAHAAQRHFMSRLSSTRKLTSSRRHVAQRVVSGTSIAFRNAHGRTSRETGGGRRPCVAGRFMATTSSLATAYNAAGAQGLGPLGPKGGRSGAALGPRTPGAPRILRGPS